MRVCDQVMAAAARLAGAGIDSPFLDAQLLMAHVLRCSRTDVIGHPERHLNDFELDEYSALVDRRSARYPLAYLLGIKEFYGIEIEVRPGVLIPRPETETLVEECLKRLDRGGVASGRELVVADIGAGSGAVAVALAANLPCARVYATEISPAALEVTRTNVEKQDLSGKVVILEGDLHEPLLPLGAAFDAVVSNPPYVPTGEIEHLQPEISLYEPRQALDGGPDGLDVYRRLVPGARELLRNGGFLAVEVGAGQAGLVSDLALSAGYGRVEVIPDLARIDRVVVAYR